MNRFQTHRSLAHFDEWERRIEKCWTSERRDHVTRYVAIGRYFYPEFHSGIETCSAYCSETLRVLLT